MDHEGYGRSTVTTGDSNVASGVADLDAASAIYRSGRREAASAATATASLEKAIARTAVSLCSLHP